MESGARFSYQDRKDTLETGYLRRLGKKLLESRGRREAILGGCFFQDLTL